MGAVTYFGNGSTVRFPTPNSPSNKTVTVSGQSVAVASQDHTSVTLAAAPKLGAAIVISTFEADLVSVSESATPAPAAPRNEGASVTLTAADNGGISICPGACTVTVPSVAVLGAGFSRSFFGPGIITFSGAVDDRSTGSTKPACALINWPDGTFHVVGGMA